MRQRMQGFTLLEMLAVIVLLGIAASVALSALSRSFGAHPERAVITQLTQTLRRAHIEALSSGSMVAVHFDLQRRQFARQSSHARVHHWPKRVHLRLISGRSIGPEFRFYPSGNASGGRIVVETSHRRQELMIDWLTSQVQVQ